MEVFQDYSYYYNAFYKDKDYMAEAQMVDRLLKGYAGNVSDIIDLGCGTGRHDVELSKMGYQCAGVDISRMMIDIARRNASEYMSNMEFVTADIRDYETEAEYEAVISLFHVMSYQNTNDDIVSAFKTARKLLKKAGRYFLFDVWYGPGVLSDKPCVRVKEAEDGENRLIRIAKPIMHDRDNVVDVQYEVFVINKETNIVQTIKETHKMRYFFRPELELLLNLAGFELVDNLDCDTLAETDFSSWTSYFIARSI